MHKYAHVFVDYRVLKPDNGTIYSMLCHYNICKYALSLYL